MATGSDSYGLPRMDKQADARQVSRIYIVHIY